MRVLLLVAGLSLAWAGARAETLTYTAVVPPTDYDAYQGQSFQVLTPGFDPALGTLASVSMTVVGSVQDSTFAAAGNTVPFAAVFNNVGGISGFGFNETDVLSQNAGTATTLTADTDFTVNAIFSTDEDLQAYATNAVVTTSFDFYSLVVNALSGLTVPYDSDDAVFSGTVTQTYVYSGIPVSEPAALGVFTFGLLVTAGLAYRRRV